MIEIFAYQKVSKASILSLLNMATAAIEKNRCKLILVVGTHGQGKTNSLQAFAAERKQEVLSLGLVVLKALQEEIKPDKLLSFLRQMFEKAGPLIIVDNIEVLFQSSLKLQPLEILKILSYDRVVIASFPGRILEGALVYAEASHAEYEVFPQYEIKDFILLDLNGEQK